MTDRSGYVYLLKSTKGLYKIGRTKHPENRLRLFAVKMPLDFELDHLIATNDMYKLESGLHQYFSSFRKDGEWFLLSDEHVQIIKEITCDGDYARVMEKYSYGIIGRDLIARMNPRLVGRKTLAQHEYDSILQDIDFILIALAQYKVKEILSDGDI